MNNFAETVKPIKTNKELENHLNAIALVNAIGRLIERLDQLDKKLDGLNIKTKAPKEKKPLTRMGRFEPYINEVLSDSKIHSTHDITEEIQTTYPDLPPFKHKGVQISCAKLALDGKIKKIAYGVYRKL